MDTTRYTIRFAKGELSQKRIDTFGLAALTSVLKYLMNEALPDFMCGIRATEAERELLIFFREGKAAVFFCDGNLQLFLPDAPPEWDIVGAVDERWGTIYFVPVCGFLPTDRAVRAVERHFLGETLELVDVSQSTDKTYAIYQDMVARGVVENA